MRKYGSSSLLPLVLILIGALSGCATMEKCRSGGCAEDAKITADVQARLHRYDDLRPITVLTLHHVVYLNGLVHAGLEKSTAESEAKHVPGVTHVVNYIAVRQGRDAESDNQIGNES
jgi:osmotically-inducible protein OsmY